MQSAAFIERRRRRSSEPWFAAICLLNEVARTLELPALVLVDEYANILAMAGDPQTSEAVACAAASASTRASTRRNVVSSMVAHGLPARLEQIACTDIDPLTIGRRTRVVAVGREQDVDIAVRHVRAGIERIYAAGRAAV